MDLLADENQHPFVVARLREAGHAVEWVADTMAGASDAAILARADIGRFVLLTYDRDFGALIFERGFPRPRAILYTRLSRAAPEDIARRMILQLEAGIAAGHIVTLTKDGARSTPFPDGAPNG